jgi:hypothetical protein
MYLGTRFKIPVFLSYNVQDPDPNLVLFAQKTILNLTKEDTDFFSF